MTDTVITCNGEPTISGSVLFPRRGAWYADVTLGGDTAITGAATLQFGTDGPTLVGTVVRSGVEVSRVSARIVGGAGGLSTALLARSYRGIPVGLILDDLARETGETLSSATSATARAHVVGAWARVEQTGAEVLADLCRRTGANWRITDAGEIWVGTEALAASTMVYELLADDPAAGVLELAPVTPTLRPGMTVEGLTCICALYAWDGRKLRARAWTESAASSDSDFAATFATACRLATWDRRYLGTYRARVLCQDADGTLQVIPTASVVPPMAGVPMRTGLPGVSVKVLQDAHVQIVFEDGDPMQPVAIPAFWDQHGTALDEVTVNAQTEVTVNAPHVRIGEAGGEVDLGAAPANGVATVASVVQISLALVVPDPTQGILLNSPVGPVTGTIGLALTPVVGVGLVLTGCGLVKAGP